MIYIRETLKTNIENNRCIISHYVIVYYAILHELLYFIILYAFMGSVRLYNIFNAIMSHMDSFVLS